MGENVFHSFVCVQIGTSQRIYLNEVNMAWSDFHLLACDASFRSNASICQGMAL